ncbi:MAG: sigma factor [Oscillospiraceae bacterium]
MTTAAEERLSLLKEAKAGSAKAVNLFAEANFGLVHMAARRFVGRGTDYDDLFQIGCLGLVKAVKNFDMEAGVVF